MFASLSWPESLLIAAVLVCFGYVLGRVDRRVRGISNRLGRLTVTFKKLEIELLATQFALLEHKSGEAERFKNIQDIRRFVDARCQSFVENGPSLADIMRGLEEHDQDDDPNYWKEGRIDKFGFRHAD